MISRNCLSFFSKVMNLVFYSYFFLNFGYYNFNSIFIIFLHHQLKIKLASYYIVWLFHWYLPQFLNSMCIFWLSMSLNYMKSGFLRWIHLRFFLFIEWCLSMRKCYLNLMSSFCFFDHLNYISCLRKHIRNQLVHLRSLKNCWTFKIIKNI